MLNPRPLIQEVSRRTPGRAQAGPFVVASHCSDSPAPLSNTPLPSPAPWRDAGSPAPAVRRKMNPGGFNTVQWGHEKRMAVYG